MSTSPSTYPKIDRIAVDGWSEARTAHRGRLISIHPGPLDFDCQIDGEHHGSYTSEEAAILAAVAHIDLRAR